MNYKKIKVADCNWFYLSDGVNIIYCQPSEYDQDYYSITSVHKPSRIVGTGFGLTDTNIKLNSQVINKLLTVFAPNWARKTDIDNVKKYKNIDEFIKYEEKFFHNLIMTDINID